MNVSKRWQTGRDQERNKKKYVECGKWIKKTFMNTKRKQVEHIQNLEANYSKNKEYKTRKENFNTVRSK